MCSSNEIRCNRCSRSSRSPYERRDVRLTRVQACNLWGSNGSRRRYSLRYRRLSTNRPIAVSVRTRSGAPGGSAPPWRMRSVRATSANLSPQRTLGQSMIFGPPAVSITFAGREFEIEWRKRSGAQLDAPRLVGSDALAGASRMVTATKAPEKNVSAPAAAIAQANPKRSATMPAESAPSA